MAKLTAVLVTLLGALMVLSLIMPVQFDMTNPVMQWVFALSVLLIGVGKLMRNYSAKPKRR